MSKNHEFVDISTPLPPCFGALFRLEFCEKNLMLYARAQTESQELIPAAEVHVMRAFLAGLDRNRLELHGRCSSAVVECIILHMSVFEMAENFDLLLADVLLHGTAEDVQACKSMTEQDRVRAIGEARMLDVMAQAEFDRLSRLELWRASPRPSYRPLM